MSMKVSACSRSAHLSLMFVVFSLFITTARSTSRKGPLISANAVSNTSRLSNRYFTRGCYSVISFLATPPTKRNYARSPVPPTTSDVSCTNTDNNKSENVDDDTKASPWNHPNLAERAMTNKQAFRSRQHVNPLAKKFQQPTVLSESWPNDVFEDLSKPIFLDIGCSRGGFLISMAMQRPHDYNYLGLEIRPMVVFHAKERIEKHNLKGSLDFVGCNANVDLERLLKLIATTKDKKTCGSVEMVTIQFPDPHFKARHAKRRVVTPELVRTLAQFMPTGATVFLQSDIQSVLDEMRLQFREHNEHFEDSQDSLEKYIPENILGVPTEREISVLERNLPVYRAVFKRTNSVVPTS